MRPLPSVRSSLAPPTTARDVITHVNDVPTPKPVKKKGRPSKAEKMKAMRAKASERVREFLEMEPKKKDVIEFIRSRVEELEDGF
jgi:hypothetical protein